MSLQTRESPIGAANMATITPPQPAPSPAPLASPAVYRMTVDEFERIAGSLNNDQVELLDGYVVSRDDMKPPHVLATERLRRRLDRIVPGGYFVREEKPIRIPEFDEPRPDISVVRGDPELFAQRHPAPEDVVLLIEVSETSLDRDKGKKRLNYARSGIPVYWIVNLVDRQLEVYTSPGPDGYQSSQNLKSGQEVAVIVERAEAGRILVVDILP
jgi:Uma2 family endonuclease